MENEIFNEEHPSKSLMSIKRESLTYNEKKTDIDNFENEIDLIDRKRGLSKDLTNSNDFPSKFDRKKN